MLNLVMIENGNVEMANFDYALIEHRIFELFYYLLVCKPRFFYSIEDVSDE
jgi:hypothetical protein